MNVETNKQTERNGKEDEQRSVELDNLFVDGTKKLRNFSSTGFVDRVKKFLFSTCRRRRSGCCCCSCGLLLEFI